MTTSFKDLNLSPPVFKATVNMGFEEMTPVQERTIPLVMSGVDVIGQAQTGTGKTAAFGIPIAERVAKNETSIKALAVAPTRELAVQVAEELNRIGQYKGIKALPIYGGQDIGRQIRALKNKPQIIVGTPGRLLDHIRRKTVRLQDVSMVILDEADEMLNMGFIDDIESILKEVPNEDRQTLLFSATMPMPIQKLARRFMKDPELISITPKEVTVPNIDQKYVELQEKQKFDALCRLLDIQPPERAIVFGRTKRRVDEVFEALSKRGYSAEGIHGDMTQSKRDSVMRGFKNGNTEILVATDVAARGLDIGSVTHVYNFDIPQDPESYVHRIGRTGRAGKSGQAITFVTSREIGHLRLIERIVKRRISRIPVPTLAETIEGQQRLAVERLMEIIKEGEYHQYKEQAAELLEETDCVTALAAALKTLTREVDTTPVKISEERPIGKKSSYKSKGQSSQSQSRGGGYGGGARRSSSKRGKYQGKSGGSSHKNNYK